jgi:CheY-like chemotaxis protein
MTLSHELRTPLTPILGWARIIQSRDYDKATVIRGIDVIERSAKAEAALVNDMLELSRIVAGKLKLEVTDVNLQSVVEAAIEVVLPEAAAKSIDIRRAIESSVPFIPGDQNRLQQVFWNLLKNAIKFTPAGGNVDISVATEESWVKIIVKDNGEGIDARYLPRVFDRFSMQDASTTRRHGGLGIGLSIVRHLVQLHGGQVVAESGGVGCGATFTVFLPHRKSSQIASSTQNLPSRCINKALRLKGARVLVVDDNADTLDYISQALQEAGATVTCAHSVSSAMDVILQFKPSILVSDIGMPDEDGLSLIRRLRTGGHSLPAVALSAHAKAEDCQRSIAAGFERHVTKPVDPYELIEVVAEVGKSTTIDRQDNTESN